MHKENWDDLRYVLAVAETGSVSAAARGLGVNHATVLRHVASFEDRHGISVFDKSARGYAIPPDRLRLIDAAREVEAAVQAVHRQIQGAQAPLRGTVRITSTDTFCTAILPQALRRVSGQAGELVLELLSTNAHVDLGRLHADITVRPTLKLTDELTGTNAGRLGFGHYGVPDVEPWLGLSGVLSRSLVAEWMAKNVPTERVQAASDSFLTLREMAASGLGQVILPCVLGDADPRLARITGIFPDLSVDIWVASHIDLADVPRIRAVRILLCAALAEDADRLLGKTAVSGISG